MGSRTQLDEPSYAKLLDNYLGFTKKVDIAFILPDEKVFAENILRNLSQMQSGVFLAFFGICYERCTKQEIAEVLRISTSKVDSVIDKAVVDIKNNPQKYGFTPLPKSASEEEMILAFLRACLSRDTSKVFSTKQMYQRIKTKAIQFGYVVETTSRIGRFGVFNTNFKLTPEGLRLLGIEGEGNDCSIG